MGELTKRDLVLPPGTYAYMQDVTKGQIKVFAGPTVINQTAQEVPVVYDSKSGKFERCNSLEEAIRQSPIAVEGYYLVLLNPAKKGEHPLDGSSTIAPELDVGRKVNVPGPVTFALWPGQSAQYIRGHHLRSNQYLLIRVYNEEEARKNWSSAVVKPASKVDGATPSIIGTMPEDLTVGKQYIIKGQEVSFYIPPTGVSVVPEGADGGHTRFVRNATTLERLEYCILVDEDGTKRFERGPSVVFPEPTETFVEANNNRRFRAVELNEIQGLHVKVIAPYSEMTTNAKGEKGKQDYKVGDELFLTGTTDAIYYPREEHSLISYDGKSKHFATAIPAGEARYVLDRLNGKIRMEHGPAMLLPDPRHEVIVRRILSDKQCQLWYPNNTEVSAYNQQLRALQASVPTTRAGAISEGDLERSAQSYSKGGGARGRYGSATAGVAAVAAMSNAVMEKSNIASEAIAAALGTEEFSRASTYTQPRSITLETKFQGVPLVEIWTGYALLVVSKTGARRVEQGPKTVLLAYDESLEVLELSMGKPKTTDQLFKTVYLRVQNNKISDIIKAETADHVQVEVYVSLRVNFEGDPLKWFAAENYIKLLCDHVRSVLKGAVRHQKVEDFYANSTDFVRDTILGKQGEKGERPGMFFADNGMRVTDVEVLSVKLGNDQIRMLLEQAQHEVVRSNIELVSAKRNLEVTQTKEKIKQQMAQADAETKKTVDQLEVERVKSELTVLLTKIDSELQKFEENKKTEGAKQMVIDLGHGSELRRQKNAADQMELIAKAEQERKLQLLRVEAETMVTKFQAGQAGFSEALLALSHNETLTKVAEALSVQNFIGGKSFTDVVTKIFAGTPLEGLMDKLTKHSPNGKPILAPSPTA